MYLGRKMNFIARKILIFFVITFGIVLIYDSFRGLVSLKTRGNLRNLGSGSNYLLHEDEIFHNRRRHLKNTCSKRKSMYGVVQEVIGTNDGLLTICLVQKAGCTFWSRITRFLNGENNMTATPLDISKYDTHYRRRYFYRHLKFRNFRHRTVIENSARVLTVRDPFSRLWSAYIDKFLLPDFWNSIGRYIVEHYRNNPTNKSLQCGNDVTFPEFVEYVVSLDKKRVKRDRNLHWYPASKICNPCLFNPEYIVKQETFSRDINSILKHLNLNMFQNDSQVDMTTFEMMDQIDYVFEIFEKIEHCVENSTLIKLLWTAFQYNAYIPTDIRFPVEKFNKTSKEIVSEVFLDVRMNWNTTKEEQRKQKRESMIDAFNSLPLKTLRKFERMFVNDFRLFEYDIEPHDIFNKHAVEK